MRRSRVPPIESAVLINKAEDVGLHAQILLVHSRAHAAPSKMKCGVGGRHTRASLAVLPLQRLVAPVLCGRRQVDGSVFDGHRGSECELLRPRGEGRCEPRCDEGIAGAIRDSGKQRVDIAQCVGLQAFWQRGDYVAGAFGHGATCVSLKQTAERRNKTKSADGAQKRVPVLFIFDREQPLPLFGYHHGSQSGMH